MPDSPECSESARAGPRVGCIPGGSRAPLRDAVRFVNGEERERGVELRGAHAEFAECGDLVVHEGDEWGDYDADARPHEGGDLVAERLATARGHQHQRVAAGGYVLNNLGLLAAEGRVAEDGGEEGEGGG